jgi:8-oxo-dGTP pyrophosphatase MutT (NUDIX family)
MSLEFFKQLTVNRKSTLGVFVCIFDSQGRVLCVRRNYGLHNWTTPGGGAKEGEVPQQTARRETFEETGFVISVGEFIGGYFSTLKNNLVLSYVGQIVATGGWVPNEEIAERHFFPISSLPASLSCEARVRIQDARKRRRGVLRLVCER